jgi:hypothetical protein
MSTKHQIVVAPPTSLDLRQAWTPAVLGCGAGALANVSAMKRAIADSPGDYGIVTYADAVPSHSENAAREAAKASVAAKAITLAARDLKKSQLKPSVIISQYDRAEAQALALEYATSLGVPFLSYLLIAPPRQLPIALMKALAPEDLVGPSGDDMRVLYKTLAPITARSGKSALAGDFESELRVSAIRERFREHLPSALRKLAAGLTPDVSPILATDGDYVAPVVVLESERFASPLEIEERVVLGRRDLIEPGTRLIVIETVTQSDPQLRLHELIFRGRDRRLGSLGAQTLTAADFAPLPTPVSTGSASRDGVLDVLRAVAGVAVVLGTASRLAPMRSSD